MHLAEPEEDVKDVAEQIVNMLMRDEAPGISEIQEDDEDAITEV